mmetsp:Transcript_14350/g.49900  ORF Transcript_14350/g.49900 Transcript_14350/m.49900 type:complete len:268 (-) Transcript_14350:704-1507(-)
MTPSCPVSVMRHSIVGVCQILTVESYDAVASVSLSDGQYRTSKMVSVCPGRPRCCICFCPTWKTPTLPSVNEQSACCVPGMNVTDWNPDRAARTSSSGCRWLTFHTRMTPVRLFTVAKLPGAHSSQPIERRPAPCRSNTLISTCDSMSHRLTSPFLYPQSRYSGLSVSQRRSTTGTVCSLPPGTRCSRSELERASGWTRLRLPSACPHAMTPGRRTFHRITLILCPSRAAFSVTRTVLLSSTCHRCTPPLSSYQAISVAKCGFQSSP